MSYATLNTQFNLPSPPPRSVFSTVRNVDGRAWFPDFTKEADPIGSLKHFVEILFYPSLYKSTFIQLKVLSVLTAIIGISIFLIILRRLYEKSFWLFRLVRRSNGTLIVPNAITAFVAIESTFAILLIALCWEVVAWFQHGQSPKYIILWIGLTWLPLILGAWCTTVGIIYARPDALSFVSPQPGKPHSWALRMGITPTVVNVFVFCIPVVQIISVVIPAVLAQQRYSQAFEHYHRWSATLQPGESLSRELLIEAQQIWFRVLDAAYYLSICMTVWEAWVCGLFICYCLAGGSLILTLRKQLETLKSFKQNCSFSESFGRQNGQRVHMRRPSDVFAAVVVSDPALQTDGDVEKQPISPSSPNLLSVQAPPRSFSISSAVSDSATLVSGDVGVKRSASQKAPPSNGNLMPSIRRYGSEGKEGKDAQTESMYFTREELENEDQPSNSFFPAVRPSAFERPTQAQSPAAKQNSHKRYLEKFYLNFLVQFIGLMLCILFFAIFCGKLITTWYSAWEANDLAPAFQIAILVVCWVTVILASVIIFAILSRTYEPLLSSFGAATQSRSSGSRRASLSRHNSSSLGQRVPGRRLSGARTWAISTLSQFSSGEHRRSQDIGLDAVRNGRAGPLSGAGRTSLHAYAELEGEHDSPNIDRDPPSPKSQSLNLRKPTFSSTPDLHASAQTPRSPVEPRRQRSFRGSVSSSTSKNSKSGGVMVEQTVSTIVEDPAVEEYYQVDRPVRAARPSPSRSDLTGVEVFTPHSMDSGLYTPDRFSRRSEWANSPATPATLWSPSTPGSTRPLVSKQERQNSNREQETDDEEWMLHRSRSDVALRRPRARPSTAGDGSVGLGIGMPSTPWTAPSVWGSGEPDPGLMQEDAEMRLRMASRPSTGNTKRP
ncbi:uncharacterized protein UTRI_00578 [Ustilago trichophora]|uniref:Uncharacterized protein n=1 Tax=Ustilago trichophora TaxID=86804 RepID=A0A5C3DV80_9BASI|nr:uncharacterized protein UTRI_00578 [Ustilago trichophora]